MPLLYYINNVILQKILMTRFHLTRLIVKTKRSIYSCWDDKIDLIKADPEQIHCVRVLNGSTTDYVWYIPTRSKSVLGVWHSDLSLFIFFLTILPYRFSLFLILFSLRKISILSSIVSKIEYSIIGNLIKMINTKQ